MKIVSMLIVILVTFGLQSLNAQVLAEKLKDKGYLVFYGSSSIFIPSKEIDDSLFLNSYLGDTGYAISPNADVLRFEKQASKYEVVVNYLINDSLISEKKVIGLLPVEIFYEISTSILDWEISDILFRFNNKDYVLKYSAYSKRKIYAIVPFLRPHKE